jgi:LEA14-like dessication related protein
MPVAGAVTHAAGRFLLAFVVRYADVPADWADRFQADGFTYRLRSAGGAAREWTGTRRWKDVEVDGGRDTMAEFVALDDVALTDVSLLSSEASARASVRNPFAFPLKIAQMTYTLLAEGREVGSGSTQGLILHPAQKNVLALPIDVDHAALLSAAGGAVVSGGDVAVKLTGRLVVRLKGGDVAIPISLSGNLSDRS